MGYAAWKWAGFVVAGVCVVILVAANWPARPTIPPVIHQFGSTADERLAYLRTRLAAAPRVPIPPTLDELLDRAPPPGRTQVRIGDLIPIYDHNRGLIHSALGIRWDEYPLPILDSPPGGESCTARCDRIRPARLQQHDLTLYKVSAIATCAAPGLYWDSGQASVAVLFHGMLGPRGLPVNDTHVLQTDHTWHTRPHDRWWDRVLDRSTAIHHPELISAVQIFSHGYYHLVAETLPRILLTGDLMRRRPHAKLLVARTPRVGEYLALIGVDESRVVWYDENRVYTADILHVPRVILVGVTHRATARMLRRALGSEIDTPAQSVQRIVYVHRGPSSSRHLDNHAEFETRLRDWFPAAEIIKLTGNETANKTRAVMREASVVIGPHGAGLSHIIFAPASATLVEIMMGVDSNMCFWNLATAIGMRHVLLVSAGRSSGDRLHVDNFEDVRRAVADALGGMTGPSFPCVP